jgi:multidrug resistance efflux pump
MSGFSFRKTAGGKMKRIALISCCLLLLSFCGNSGRSEIKAPGIVDGDIITLKSLVSGRVDRILLKEGSSTETGQLIIDINRDKTRNKLQELEIISREIENNRQKMSQKMRFIRSNIKYLDNQVQRFRRLKEKNSVSGEKLEAMELKLLDARTRAFELKKSLDNLNIQAEKITNQQEYLQLIMEDHQIKSPANGVLLETFISPGENVFPGTPLADILDTSTLYIEVFIEENEISLLKLGQRARIIIDGMEERDLSGSIIYFGKKAEFSPKYVISEKERKSLLYRVKIALDREIGLFKIGMPVTVYFNRAE